MKIRSAMPVLLSLLMVACGESTPWPPHQAELSYVFSQQKATFILIEKEMAADGLQRMAPALFSENSRSPGVPQLPSTQTEKYAALFDRTRMYLYVTRLEQSTTFEMLIQNVGPRLYLSRFIHTSTGNSLPNCAPAMRQNSCGNCSIPLESGWLLEYDWFPADPEEEASEC